MLAFYQRLDVGYFFRGILSAKVRSDGTVIVCEIVGRAGGTRWMTVRDMKPSSLD